MNVPEKLCIVVIADGRPLEGIPVVLTFVMERKNHHDLVFGPSDASGEIRVSGDEIRSEARKSMEFFLMDYADIDTFWTGTVRVRPMNRDALGRALSAFRTFRRYKYPAGYEQMLQQADAILAKLPGARLESSVRVEPSSPLKIETVPVDA